MLAGTVSLVGHHRQRSQVEDRFRGIGHGVQLAPVGRLVGHRMMDDQTGLGIHDALHVVGGRFGSGALAHRPGIRLALDQGRAVFLVHAGRQPVEFGASGPKRGERCRHRARLIVGLICIGFVQSGEIGRDLAVEAGSLLGEAGAADDLLRTGDGAELRAVQRHEPRGKQPRVPAQQHEGAGGPDDRRPVVAPEVGDRLEVRSQSPEQPHGLDIASTGPLQTPRGTNLVEVAPDVELQKITRIVARAPRRSGNRADKAET